MIGRADIEGSKSDVATNAWPPQASYPCGNFSDTSRRKELSARKGSMGHAFAVRIRTENRDRASFCPFALREVSVLAELALGHLRYRLTDVPPQSNSPPGTVPGKGSSASDSCETPAPLALARGPPSDPSPFLPGERGNDGSGGISGSTTPNDAGTTTAVNQDPRASPRQATHPEATSYPKATSHRPRAQQTKDRNANQSLQPRRSRRRQRHVSRLCYTSRVSSQSRTRVKLNRVFFPRRSFQARSLGCGFAR